MGKSITTKELVENTVPLEKRIHRSNYFKTEYPNSVPIFVQYHTRQSIHRYVVPRDNNFGHLLIAFRRKLSLRSSVGIISLVEKEQLGDRGDKRIACFQVSTSTSIGELADKFLHDDGFLYINITTENVFG